MRPVWWPILQRAWSRADCLSPISFGGLTLHRPTRLNKLDGGDTRAELANYVCNMNIHTCKLKSVLRVRLVGEELKKANQSHRSGL